LLRLGGKTYGGCLLPDASSLFPPHLQDVAMGTGEVSPLISTFDAKIIRKLKWNIFEI
jgi:hypothetical protein